MSNKEQLLLEAGRTVFANKDYRHTSVADIANQCRVAVGSFYNYFDSKEDIFLKIYIEENRKMRQQLMESIDWNSDIETIIKTLFSTVSQTLQSNQILAEWNKSNVSNVLGDYYRSEQGKKEDNFHEFIIKLFREKLTNIGLSPDQINKVISTYELLYFIDCNINTDDFPNYNETLQTLVTYFLKGVSMQK